MENSMKKEDAIKYLQQLYPNGGHCWLDEQRIEAIGMAVKALQEEPVSKQNLSNVQRTVKDWKEPVSDDLEKAATNFIMHAPLGDYHIRASAFKAGANWQKQQMFDKFNEWCQEELYIHPHDCHVVQYVSDKALEDVDDFVEEFKKTINSKL